MRGRSAYAPALSSGCDRVAAIRRGRGGGGYAGVTSEDMLGEMRKRAAVVAAVMVLLACGKSGAARLEGHWKGTRADGVGSEAQGAANSFATQTEIDVKGDVITV